MSCGCTVTPSPTVLRTSQQISIIDVRSLVQVASRHIIAKGVVLATDGESVRCRVDVHFHNRYEVPFE